MQSAATTVAEYIAGIPKERQAAFSSLRKVILKHLPKGFKELIEYGHICYSVPHSLYPAGYHCNPKIALPFLSIASQKNFIAMYHMGIYADAALLKWFTDAYAKTNSGKLDMGKSCIRFKNIDKIPLELIGELAEKISPQQWIALYEKSFRSTKAG